MYKFTQIYSIYEGLDLILCSEPENERSRPFFEKNCKMDHPTTTCVDATRRFIFELDNNFPALFCVLRQLKDFAIEQLPLYVEK